APAPAPAPAQNSPANGGVAPADGNTPAANAPATANPPIPWTAQADPGSAEVSSLSASYPLAVTPRYSTDFPLASQPYALHLNGKEAELCDLRTGQIVGKIRDTEALPNRPAVSPDGTAMAAKLLKPGDDHIRIWSFKTGRIAGDRIISNSSGPISILKFSKHDQLVGIRTASNEAVVMDLAQAAQPRVFSLARPTPHARLHAEAVGVSPSGKYLAAIMGGRLVIHDLASGNCVGTSQLPSGALDEFGGCKEIVFSRDGKQIAALCTRATANWLHLLEWNAATGELVQNKLWNGTDWVRTTDYVMAHDEHPLSALPDGSGWAIFGRLIWKRGAESPEIAFPSDNDPHPRCLIDNDKVVARATGEQGATSLQLITRAGATSPPAVATNTPNQPASGSWQATADRAALVPRIDPKALAVFGNVPHVPHFSQRPSEFAACAIRDEYVVFDLRTGAEVKRFKPAMGKPQPVIDISLDGRYLATAAPLLDESWKFEIWDVSTGKLVMQAAEKIGRGEQTLEFLNNRELLIAHGVQDSSQRRYAIWDIEKQQRSREFTSPATSNYLSASHLVSPGGRWAIATSTSAIEVLDLTSGKLAGTAPLPLGANRTVPSRVVSSAMSVDGSQLYLVLQYGDKEAKLVTCDMTSGKLAVRPVDNARLTTFWDNDTVVWFSPWLVEDCNWIIGKQAAINIENGAIIGPLGLKREATVLSLPKNQIYVGHTPIDLVISPAAALTAITIKTDAAGNIAKDVESLRPKAVVVINNPKPKPLEPANNPPMPPVVAPADDPTNKPPAWTATVDLMPGAKPLVAAKQFDVPIARNTRFITSDRGGNFIAVMDENEGQAQVLDLATGKAVGKRFAIPRQAEMATIDPSGAYVAFSTDGDELTIQAVQSGETARVKREGSFVDCHYLSFAADQKLVAAFENDHHIELLVYKPTGGEPEKRIALGSDNADWSVRNYGLTISPGGRYLAALSYRALEIYDLQGSAESQVAVVPFTNTRSQVITFQCDGIRFAPDGKRLAATYRQGQQDYITLWSMESGEPLVFRPSAKSNHLRTIEHSDYGPRLSWFEDNETLLYTGTMLLDAATACPYWVINQDDFASVLPLGSRGLLTITSGQDNRLAAVALPQEVSTARTAVRSSPAVNTPSLKAIAARTAPPASEQIRRPPTPDGLTTGIPQRTVTLARFEKNSPPMRLAISPTGVLASELVVDFIDTSKPVITSGPLTPERDVTLELFDIAT
ncbi:MAG TPA: hypothetical protein VL096_20700, partial [Pirellulaceae bacterium]|nr:hypothetical protein [Pirellulaceae bacterium]